MPERDPRAEAEVLIRKAEDDANAMRLLADAEISDEIVGFHAQQAVEKWLKAVLGSRGIEFEYTHDLRRLIAEVTAVLAGSSAWVTDKLGPEIGPQLQRTQPNSLVRFTYG